MYVVSASSRDSRLPPATSSCRLRWVRKRASSQAAAQAPARGSCESCGGSGGQYTSAGYSRDAIVKLDIQRPGSTLERPLKRGPAQRCEVAGTGTEHCYAQLVDQ